MQLQIFSTDQSNRYLQDINILFCFMSGILIASIFCRCHICLKNYTREVTHNLWQNFEEGSGMLHLLLTISGTTASETITDLTTYEENPAELEGIRERYVSFYNYKYYYFGETFSSLHIRVGAPSS